jgi:hypothetical protein
VEKPREAASWLLRRRGQRTLVAEYGEQFRSTPAAVACDVAVHAWVHAHTSRQPTPPLLCTRGCGWIRGFWSGRHWGEVAAAELGSGRGGSSGARGGASCRSARAALPAHGGQLLPSLAS